ncbi:MAG: HalOD1 output domain-containing protein [Halovenus sp.]
MVATQAGVELKSFERHDGPGTCRAGYDTETTSPAMAVVATLVEATGVGPTQIGLLQETIETDALDEIVRSQGLADGTVQVSFVFEGRSVTVTSDGVVTVAPPGENPKAAPTEGGAPR